MKKLNNYFPFVIRVTVLCLFTFGFSLWNGLMAQDSSATETINKPRPVTTFDGQFIVDNQTVTVSRKKVLNIAIQHRFGLVSNGRQDLYGIFGPANIRLGFNYTPINNLSVGFGVTKINYLVDFNAKYALVKQMDSGGWPVSISYFGNIAIDAREKQGNFVNGGDRISYFNQLLIARKISEKLSVQVSPSLSHFNNVEAYRDKDGNVIPKMKNDHFAISFLGRYKLTERFHLIANYDQALTQHTTNNPQPNICFGIETTTISHSFQIFAGNSGSIVPQYVNFYNQNNYRKGQFLIGFNITRRWNFN
ncbi:MAG: DUF5777 family beta-barrel protein [Chitinophagales bacterium]